MSVPSFAAVRVVFRRPSLLLAEIAWRWSFASAASILLALAAAEYLRSVPVARRDQFLLDTGNPLLIARGLLHALHGGGPKLVQALFIVAAALFILWIALASLGRSAALFALVPRPGRGWRMRSIVGVNFLRASVASTALIAVLGCFAAATLVAPAEAIAPGIAFQMAFGLMGLAWLAWSALNWVLALAPLFVMRDAEDTFGSIRATLEFVGDYLPALLTISGIFAAVHLALLLFFMALALPVLGLAGALPGALPAFLICILALIYFALAAGLYVARLAAYIAVAGQRPPALSQLLAPAET
jgi:hypothetical protein